MKHDIVELEIERMELYGVSAVAESRIVAAMERELATLITERGLPPSMAGAEVVEIDAAVIHVPEGPYAAATGKAIARRMFEAWWAKDEDGRGT